MAAPSVVMRFEGMMFLSATFVPPKQPVRLAGVVMVPLELKTGAVQVLAALLGSRSTPSSAVPTTPSGPRRRSEKSPPSSASVGTVLGAGLASRLIFFHSCPPKKKNLSFLIGPPKL